MAPTGPTRCLIPPPDDQRKCIAVLHHQNSRRCKAQPSQADLNEALRLIAGIWLRSPQDTNTKLEEVIRLRTCPTHRQKLEAQYLMCQAKIYSETLLQSGQGLRPGAAEDPPFLPYNANPSLNLVRKLKEPINPNQDPSGFLYVFQIKSAPGFVKIGYGAKSLDDMLKRWRKCHSEPTICFTEHFDYPERMEEIVHLNFFRNRFTYACKICNKRHDEWFKISVEEAQLDISRLKTITQRAPLYTKARRLSSYWSSVICGSADTTIATLAGHEPSPRSTSPSLVGCAEIEAIEKLSGLALNSS